MGSIPIHFRHQLTISDSAPCNQIKVCRLLDNRTEWIDDLVDATNRNQTLLDEITSTNRNRPKKKTKSGQLLKDFFVLHIEEFAEFGLWVPNRYTAAGYLFAVPFL